LQTAWRILRVQTITATFEDGVLKPTHPLDLPAHAEVRLTIELLPASLLAVGNLNGFLRSLPALGDDAEEYAQDIRAVRAEFPAEANARD
jgi:predicted DNA-binding antitoxin AbrB/MazE fold protein